MNDIDRMDMIGYLRIRAWYAVYQQQQKEPRRRYIDQIWPTNT